MNGLIRRSARWKPPLLFVLVLLIAQCGDESEVVVEELDCRIQGFEGGSYTFEVNSVAGGDDACPIALLGLDPVGEQFGPVDLPATSALPTTRVIPDVPLVGSVTVNISTDGKVIRIAGAGPITVVYPDIGSITATVSGILCPDPKTTRVDGQVTVRIVSGPPALDLFLPCNVTVLATGTL